MSIILGESIEIQKTSLSHRQTEEDEAIQTKALPYRLPQVSRISPISIGSANLT